MVYVLKAFIDIVNKYTVEILLLGVILKISKNIATVTKKELFYSMMS